MRIFEEDETQSRRILPIAVHKGVRINNDEQALMLLIANLPHLGSPSVTVMGYTTDEFISTQIDWFEDPGMLVNLMAELAKGSHEHIGRPEVLMLTQNAYEVIEGTAVVLHAYVVTRDSIVEIIVSGASKDDVNISAETPTEGAKKSALEHIQSLLFSTA